MINREHFKTQSIDEVGAFIKYCAEQFDPARLKKNTSANKYNWISYGVSIGTHIPFLDVDRKVGKGFELLASYNSKFIIP